VEEGGWEKEDHLKDKQHPKKDLEPGNFFEKKEAQRNALTGIEERKEGKKGTGSWKG